MVHLEYLPMMINEKQDRQQIKLQWGTSLAVEQMLVEDVTRETLKFAVHKNGLTRYC